ncbi:hypothetical protein ACIQRW_02630 [Streptomyces sp. NPDC091287]|uniref:hypothetical protein n=1 Tax=Streptomyces sp. NPDC091287 TaxID=3365988 RepID=UPI0037FE6679
MAIPTLCLVVFTGLMGFEIILPLLPLLPLLPYAADAFVGSGFAVLVAHATVLTALLTARPRVARPVPVPVPVPVGVPVKEGSRS